MAERVTAATLMLQGWKIWQGICGLPAEIDLLCADNQPGDRRGSIVPACSGIGFISTKDPVGEICKLVIGTTFLCRPAQKKAFASTSF